MLTTRFKKLFKNLRHKYRLVIYNETTYDTEYSLLLSKLNVLLLMCTLFLIGMLMSVLLFTFTPFKYYLPGFGEAGVRKQLREVVAEAEELKKRAKENDLWVENIKQVLSGKLPADKIHSDSVIIMDSVQ